MKVVIHANSVPWQKQYLPLFQMGFAKHDIIATHSTEDVCVPGAVNVIFANNSWKQTMRQCLAQDIPLLTVGRAFFGSRHDMVAIGWDGFNGDADFCLPDDGAADPSRWKKHGFKYASTESRDNDLPVLVCGEFRPMEAWYATLVDHLQGERVWFRPHPFVNNFHSALMGVAGWEPAPNAGQDEIHHIFPKVKAVVTFDSIAGCDAVFAGVPSVAYGKNSAARLVSAWNWEEFAGTKSPLGFKIRDINLTTLSHVNWRNRLAWCQWDHDEIANGDFWEHLKGRV